MKFSAIQILVGAAFWKEIKRIGDQKKNQDPPDNSSAKIS